MQRLAGNIEAAGPGVGFRVPAQRRFSVAGLTVTLDRMRYHNPSSPLQNPKASLQHQPELALDADLLPVEVCLYFQLFDVKVSAFQLCL